MAEIRINVVGNSSKKIQEIAAEIRKLEALQKKKFIGDKARSEKINRSLDIQRERLRKLQKSYTNVGTAAQVAASKTAAGMAKVGKSISLTTRLITSLRTTMITTFGVFGAIRLIGNTISTLKDFEQAMASVSAITGAVGEDLETLTDIAIKVSQSGIFSATEIADLEIKLAKLGFTIMEISNMAQGIVDLATATGENLGTAAELTASTIRGLGLAATDTRKIVDQLGKSFVTSGLDINKYRESIKFIAPIAKDMGIELDAIVAILGQLADRQIFGSLAGTAFRRILIRLADSSSNLAKAVGFTVRSGDDLIKAFQVLKEEGTTFEELLQLVDVRSLTAASALIDVADATSDYRDVVASSNGHIREMADVQLNTLNNQLKNLKQNYDALLLSIGSDEGGKLAGITGIIEDISDVFKGTVLLNEKAPDLKTSWWNAIFPPVLIANAIKDYNVLKTTIKDAVIEEQNLIEQQKADEIKAKAIADARSERIRQFKNDLQGLSSDELRKAFENANKQLAINIEIVKQAAESGITLSDSFKKRLVEAREYAFFLQNELRKSIEVEIVSEETLNAKIKELTEARRTQNTSTAEGKRLYDEFTSQIIITQRELDTLTGKLKKNKEAVDKEVTSYSVLTTAIKDLNDQLKEAVLLGDVDKIVSITTQLDDVNKAKKSLDDFTNAIVNNQEQFDKIIKDIQDTPIAKRDKFFKIMQQQVKDEAEALKEEKRIIEERKRAFKDLARQVGISATQIADSLVDSADRRVDAINNAINETQSALQIELDLNKQGFASNVKLKQEELDKLKTLREQALEDQKKALAVQRTIESATQAINLATAVSNVIKSLTGTLGFLGILASVGAGASLFAVFESLKKQAAEVTTFEKGGWRELGGQRHSQGGVNLGAMGEAEKGEVVSVFNRGAVRKHKGLITNFTDMVNDGRVDFNMNHDVIGGVGKEAVIVNSTVSLDDSSEIQEMNSLMKKNLKQKDIKLFGKDRIVTIGTQTRIIRG